VKTARFSFGGLIELFWCLRIPLANVNKKFGIITVAVTVVAYLVGWQFYSRQSATEVTPAPRSEVSTPADPASSVQSSNTSQPVDSPAPLPERTILQRLVSHDTNVFKLSPDELQKFLARNGTNAESLLAAFNVTSDKEFLREAVRRYPESAFVLVSALAHNVSPEQRGEWIEQLQRIAPDNPLANYFSAREHLKNQQPELALQEFMEASSKQGFHDFTVERIQGLEDMYLGAGHSAAEAKALAMSSVQMPTIRHLRELGRDMSKLQRQYADAGDAESAQILARQGLSLAANLNNGGAQSLISQMVGNVVEKEFLRGLDADANYDFMIQSPAERLAQLQAQDKSIRDSARFFDHWMQQANEGQLVSYFDRLKLYGEAAALQWARTQLTEISSAP
jgi:hypothetical protein